MLILFYFVQIDFQQYHLPRDGQSGHMDLPFEVLKGNFLLSIMERHYVTWLCNTIT